MEFNFEGEFLGFSDSGHKYKYLRLKVATDELQIKVAKALRPFVKLSFRVGEKIRVSGVSKPSQKTHQLKLKALRIIPIEYAHVVLPEPQQSPPCQSKIKVRVCQKSKCLKRGGKSLCESMQAALKDWDLQDQITIEPTGCLGRCSSAPNLMIQPGKKLHSGICIKTLPKFERLVQTLLTTGKG
jgi:(2Fe-2S) ferredoxin